MSAHTRLSPSIAETSETELISGTESFSSADNHNQRAIQQELIDASIDSLFEQLSQEQSKSVIPDAKLDNDDEFKKIHKYINKLPKLQSKLEDKLSSSSSGSRDSVIKFDDPVDVATQAKAKKSNEVTDAGSRWFNMKQPELTASVRRDLQVIKQRAALDPKRHYKKEKWEIPKYFEMGTIIEGNTEFYSSRMNRKDRGKTLVEEVLNDNDSKKYFKRKYSEIQDKKTSGRKGHYKKVKDMRKKF
ncbi:rRNA-processing protein Fcf2p [[Candida] railenensis]|uniref:rRNA-processing protein Fcf2p n=1 Tax=[Candida] railenensis TaxID=45579 RepID=A0A9P0VVT1_9ASCO|nr:rRNA-processing protein Fcf2p [[Candida] railenensis]